MPEKPLILQVDELKIEIIPDSGGKKIGVLALGQTSSMGWTNPELRPRATDDPNDDVLEFDFVADRPAGSTPAVLTPINAYIELDISNGKIKALKVFARMGFISGYFLTLPPSPPSPPFPRWTFPNPFAEDKPPVFTTMGVGEENSPGKWLRGEKDPRGMEVPPGEFDLRDFPPGGPFGTPGGLR